MATPARLTEDLYGLTELRDRLPEVVDKARETGRPMVITRHSKALAAIIAIDELERLYDLEDGFEAYRVVKDFELAEARGEVEWLTDEQAQAHIDELVERAKQRAAAKQAPAGATSR